MPASMQQITDYLYELGSLKLVNRKTYVKGEIRVENSAEHSWHLAMACWNIAETFNLQLNHEKLIKLALVHDLGEIDAGDTFLYSKDRTNAHIKERNCVARLQDYAGNGCQNLTNIWEEQETGISAETKLLKAVDRLLPFMYNIKSQGKAWRELKVKRSQVAAAHSFIKNDFPEIHQWMSEQVKVAVSKGWLIDE
ncbi:metal dependent phosphohydrolase [Catenovulum agarivorans DS-2]|uniref:Metal dependent phosphohydrolase n=1 Tax=Catenovulum agarivorans DS-2 TaxID=1328313 RepID=W7QVX3_9ALTE|nr:HD domain-containing protein [Catenovulum agarivorans]EWH09430.1 metal dependent phosphohydrolase [Catenovulum agarivorans DS-2]